MVVGRRTAAAAAAAGGGGKRGGDDEHVSEFFFAFTFLASVCELLPSLVICSRLDGGLRVGEERRGRRGRDGEESGGSGSVISGNMIFAEATSHHKDTRLTSEDRTDAGSQADQEREIRCEASDRQRRHGDSRETFEQKITFPELKVFRKTSFHSIVADAL